MSKPPPFTRWPSSLGASALPNESGMPRSPGELGWGHRAG
jgi:hypothetical protein